VESRDLISVSRIVSRPNFASLGLEGFRSRLGLEGYRSRSQAHCLETWNITSIWLSKTIIQRVFSLLYLQARNHENRSEKCEKFEKNQLGKRWQHFFEKFRLNPQILKSRVSVLEFLMKSRSRISVLVSEFLMNHRSRSLNEVSDSKVTVSTTSLLFSVANAKRKHNWIWSVKYFILRIRFNKISLFRMLLKRLKLHWITTITENNGTKFFLHTSMQNRTIWQHCSTTPVW